MKITVKQKALLLDVLMDAIGGASKTKAKKFLKYGSVRRNGQTVKHGETVLAPGDEVEIALERSARLAPGPDLPFPVLYEDPFLVAVEKPPGILTSGSAAGSSTTLHREVSGYVKAQSGARYRAWVVHRLDREVSGIVLFARSRAIQQKIKGDWKRAEKRYFALVEGRPPQEQGRVESWLKEDERLRVHSTQESEGAKHAVTHYRLLKTLGEYSLLEVRLETGRKNQIRVHLSDLGCPVVGDRRYGASQEVIRRIRLHGFYLAFFHPETGERITVESPMPEGFLSPGKRDERYK